MKQRLIKSYEGQSMYTTDTWRSTAASSMYTIPRTLEGTGSVGMGHHSDRGPAVRQSTSGGKNMRNTKGFRKKLEKAWKVRHPNWSRSLEQSQIAKCSFVLYIICPLLPSSVNILQLRIRKISMGKLRLRRHLNISF